MNSTSGRCVMAHSDRLRRFMIALRVQGFLRCAGYQRTLDGAHLQPGLELLHAERDDPVAVVDAGGDQRGVLGE